eukprot:UN01414
MTAVELTLKSEITELMSKLSTAEHYAIICKYPELQQFYTPENKEQTSIKSELPRITLSRHTLPPKTDDGYMMFKTFWANHPDGIMNRELEDSLEKVNCLKKTLQRQYARFIRLYKGRRSTRSNVYGKNWDGTNNSFLSSLQTRYHEDRTIFTKTNSDFAKFNLKGTFKEGFRFPLKIKYT